MIIVSDIWEDVQAVLGTCDDAVTYNKINEAQEMLANLGNWDPLTVLLDICTQGCEITLPDDIEVPLAINVGGVPSDFRNKWFEFHMNGPGTQCCSGVCEFAWQDNGNFPTFRDPIQPSTISAYPKSTEMAGLNIRVFGYDQNGQWIMTLDSNNVMQDGFDVPIITGLGAGMTGSQKVKRITRIMKPVTNGFIEIQANDTGSSTGSTLLGLIRPNVTEPQFRRIKVSGAGTQFLTSNQATCKTWVRMRARKKTFKVTSQIDPIPLHSVTAIKMMVMAIAKYEKDILSGPSSYAEYFSAARDALMLEQATTSGPNQIKIQFQSAYAFSRGCDRNMI